MNIPVTITGGFGLIGSALIRLLNGRGVTPRVIEKKDRIGAKWRNVRGLRFDLIEDTPSTLHIGPLVHLGADVDTTAPMTRELWENNVDYSVDLLRRTSGRFIYASSGAIFGAEEANFAERIEGMMPENAYAFTKWQLDSLFAGRTNVYGLRFFNVYDTEGREAHKGSMKSLVARALDIKDGVFDIFKTGRADIPDGEQARDFVHVDDVTRTIWHFIETEDTKGGLFNVGTGVATSFNQVADILGLEKSYIEMPAVVKGAYQYRTCANLTKLRAHGYTAPFMTVAEGIAKMRAANQGSV